MRDDNSTGQLFFIALLLLLWTNRKRQSNKYFHDTRFVWSPLASVPLREGCNSAATQKMIELDMDHYGNNV